MEVYDRPVSRFAADFIGDSNFIPGRIDQVDAGVCKVETPVGRLTGRCQDDKVQPGQEVFCAIRPEAFTIASTGQGVNQLSAVVERIAFLGELLYVHLTAARGISLLALGLQGSRSDWRPGSMVGLMVPPEQVVILRE
jgi:ABC-type Fe3+/spermidine/putrescine transport system ATPase subunit